MRLNKFIALATGLSRRSADGAIAAGRVQVNGQPPSTGYSVQEQDTVTLDGQRISTPAVKQTIMLHKPAGYVVSRDGQGSPTIYALVPPEYHSLKPVGRLDKDSSGLLLLTNDGDLAHQLTHPGFIKEKVYNVSLDKPLQPRDQQAIELAIELDDGPSALTLEYLGRTEYRVRMHEGRNRQIRRTFAARGYTVTRLHRTNFGPYSISNLRPGSFYLV